VFPTELHIGYAIQANLIETSKEESKSRHSPRHIARVDAIVHKYAQVHAVAPATVLGSSRYSATATEPFQHATGTLHMLPGAPVCWHQCPPIKAVPGGLQHSLLGCRYQPSPMLLLLLGHINLSRSWSVNALASLAAAKTWMVRLPRVPTMIQA